MSTKRFRTIEDCGRHGAMVQITCRRCGRKRIFPPGVINFLFVKSPPNWLFDTVSERMVCYRCGAKGPDVRPCGWKGDR